MLLPLPELSLVVLIGPSGAGKSSLARRLFKPTEILSSDTFRGWVSDDENAQHATNDAFEVLHYVARKRLARGLLTVIDATNVRPEDRKPLVKLAREFHMLPVAIVVATPEHICRERNAARPDRQFGFHVIRNQRLAMRNIKSQLPREGFRHVFFLHSQEDVDNAVVERQPLWNNRKHDRGPFDIIGDVHGCYDELLELLAALGYTVSQRPGMPEGDCDVEAPVIATSDGQESAKSECSASNSSSPSRSDPRKLLFLGDLNDRGPKTPAVYRLVMKLVAEGKALCVPGNHDMKLLRALRGKNVNLTHGLAESIAQLDFEPPEFRAQVAEFIDKLVSHYVLDSGRLVAAHAGMKESMQGRGSGAVREFALYGETTGETDEFGLPVRYNWAADYRGRAAVVYGHTPVPDAQWLNNTVCIDTGCVFGGALTALRWPEREFVSVKSRAVYSQPRKPFLPDDALPAPSLQQQHDDILDLQDLTGKRIIETSLVRAITVRAENAAAALEIMSRFAADPRWLIYLPPTMSPCETSREGAFLEHPREAFEHFRTSGVGRVICEEKHMGSRAVAVVCKDHDVAARRFGIRSSTPTLGIIYTRTGRAFFNDAETEQALLARLRNAAISAGLFDELATDWLCLDCELMPWSAKAKALLTDQYAVVGAAANAALSAATEALTQAAARTPAVEPLLAEFSQRRALAAKYVDAYRRYCWDVKSIDDFRLAPFHLLAGENHVYTNKDHLWHMQALARLAATGDPIFIATPSRLVDLSDQASEDAATDWWLDLTSRGGEGMVVKPFDFITRGQRGLVQPALKVRGPEYLRIIYGPEYSLPANLDRLRSRGTGAKRSLALREFALGIEGLRRFVRNEPLRRVHECVVAVLAMESEPVDPRL